MTDAKFVVVLNKRYEAAQLLSAIGHVTVGLAGSASNGEDLSLVDYRDADGGVYRSISDWPFIVLRGGGGQIATCRQRLEQAGLPAIAYLDTMIVGGSEAQQKKTQETPTEQLEIMALATFGERSEIDPLTKRFSVWR